MATVNVDKEIEELKRYFTNKKYLLLDFENTELDLFFLIDIEITEKNGAIYLKDSINSGGVLLGEYVERQLKDKLFDSTLLGEERFDGLEKYIDIRPGKKYINGRDIETTIAITIAVKREVIEAKTFRRRKGCIVRIVNRVCYCNFYSYRYIYVGRV